MRRPVTRVFGLVALYIAVFVVLVNIQFYKNGNFTLLLDGMTVRGNYLPVSPVDKEPSEESLEESSEESAKESAEQYLTGGVKITFAGLEFNLSGDGERGLLLVMPDDTTMPADPVSMTVAENSVLFTLPGGVTLSFSSLNEGSELKINAFFSEEAEGVAIPVNTRRASPVRDGEKPGFVYGGVQYYFTPIGLQEGRLVFSGNSSISYRTVPKERIFVPADYVIAQAQSQQSYNEAIALWRDNSYGYWSQNASGIRDDDTAAAYLGEALQRGRLEAAIASIPADFRSQHGYFSSPYLGGMSRANRGLTEAYQTKFDRLSRHINAGSPDFLYDEHSLNFLQVRSLTSLTGAAVEVIRKIDPETLTAEHCPGLLEAYGDFRQWRLSGENPVTPLIEKICLIVSENLRRDSENDLVSAAPEERVDPEYNLRLGRSLLLWAESADNPEWAAIGRSLVLSSLTQGGDGAAKLYGILDPGVYYPRERWLMAGGLWIWTVSPTASAVVQQGDIYNISVSFPVNATHYLMIRGIRPFAKLQLHDMDYRTASDFESWNSSGWVYYQQDQTLVVKLKHRTSVENIRIFYRVEAPPPPVEIPEVITEEEVSSDGT